MSDLHTLQSIAAGDSTLLSPHAVARAAMDEIERMRADSAATLRALQAILDRTRILSADMGGKHRYSLDGSREASEAVHAGLCLVAQPHSGTAILEDLKRKDEQVTALGDALWGQMAPGLDWHSRYCKEVSGTGCTTDCLNAQAALRLAGLLK